jgi:hydroxymethylbilane synthase
VPTRALLLALRPDLDVVAVRGNIDTRIGYATSGELDAVVLAAAGLARIGRLDEASELFAPDTFVPAPGQGALAVECRDGDTEVVEALAALDVPAVRFAVAAERQVLATLEAGCSAPVGAHAVAVGDDLVLQVAAEDPSGVLVRRRRAVPLSSVTDLRAARRLGAEVAADLLEHELAQTPVAVGGGAQENHPLDRPVDGPRPDPESGS